MAKRKGEKKRPDSRSQGRGSRKSAAGSRSSGKPRSSSSTKRSAGSTTKPKGPRSQTLPDPSFERVRSTRLDGICESIRDQRETMNEAKGEERGLVQAAL